MGSAWLVYGADPAGGLNMACGAGSEGAVQSMWRRAGGNPAPQEKKELDPAPQEEEGGIALPHGGIRLWLGLNPVPQGEKVVAWPQYSCGWKGAWPGLSLTNHVGLGVWKFGTGEGGILLAIVLLPPTFLTHGPDTMVLWAVFVLWARG